MANIIFVDADDNVIGYGSRAEAIEKGLIHRIARVFLFNPCSELLIQRRSPHHVSLPGKWDQSAAGHVDEGEEYAAAAVRELREEVGIENVPLKEIVKFYFNETDEPKIKKRFNVLFVGHNDGTSQIDDYEVSDARWISLPDLEKWMDEKPDDFTQGFIKCLEAYKMAVSA